MLIERVLEKCVNTKDWQKTLITVILWFSDRDGYKDAVVNKYSELRNQSDAASEQYEDRIKIDIYALIGAKIYGQYDGGVDLRFVSILIQYKLPLAEKIANQFPSFSSVYDYLRINNDRADLQGDFDELFKASELFEEIDCAILLAAIGTFLDRSNDDRSTSNVLISIVEKALNKPNADVVGMPAISLLCVALWFSDYKNYKNLVFEQIKKLSDEGWYSEGKVIDLEEVKDSIEQSHFN